MVATLDIERIDDATEAAAEEAEASAALGGPYRVVLERLQRLVKYREQMLHAASADPGDPKPASELVRIRQMVREVHRAVSMNADAKAMARRIDPGE
jgi:hypothetical protein